MLTVPYLYHLVHVFLLRKNKFIVKQPQIGLLGDIPEETVSMSVVCLQDLPVKEDADDSDADDHDC